jgi:hypothetical protein
MSTFRPADVCKALLAALEGAEGRRRMRKRDQTPDAIGLAVKREILERVVQQNPDGENFEAWLLQYAQASEAGHPSGAVTAMARAVLDEWRLAHAMGDFKNWLDRGAPSDDASGAAPARSGETDRTR